MEAGTEAGAEPGPAADEEAIAMLEERKEKPSRSATAGSFYARADAAIGASGGTPSFRASRASRRRLRSSPQR